MVPITVRGAPSCSVGSPKNDSAAATCMPEAAGPTLGSDLQVGDIAAHPERSTGIKALMPLSRFGTWVLTRGSTHERTKAPQLRGFRKIAGARFFRRDDLRIIERMTD